MRIAAGTETTYYYAARAHRGQIVARTGYVPPSALPK